MKPFLAPAPTFSLRYAKPKAVQPDGPTQSAGIYWERLVAGKPDQEVRALVRSIGPRGVSHDRVLAITADLVRLGSQSHPGVKKALAKGRRRQWREDKPERMKEWDDAVRGAVDDAVTKGQYPLVTFPLSQAWKDYYATRDQPKAEAIAPAVSSILPPALQEASLREGVQAQLQYMRDRRDAQAIDAEEQALQDPKPPVDVVTLDALLERPVKYAWLVEGLAPAGSNCLVIAPAKTGKTTLIGSLVYSLLTGEPFLGRHAVRRLKGTIVMLNYEVTPETFGAWLGSLGLTQDLQRRVVVLNLRGRENLLATEAGRATLVALLREHRAEVVTVDPFTEAFSGTSQDNNTEVSQFLSGLRRVVTDGGAQELFLVAHAGHQSAERGQTSQVRVRGASVLEGWTDANWRLSKPVNMDGDPRFLEADGRDVRLEKDRLDFDPVTRRLTLSGAGGPGVARNNAKAALLLEPVYEIVAAQGGISNAGIGEALRREGHTFQKGNEGAAIRQLVEAGRIVRHRDGQSMRHWLPTAVPAKFQDLKTFPITPSTITKGTSK